MAYIQCALCRQPVREVPRDAALKALALITRARQEFLQVTETERHKDAPFWIACFLARVREIVDHVEACQVLGDETPPDEWIERMTSLSALGLIVLQLQLEHR